jgi:DinB superfamily
MISVMEPAERKRLVDEYRRGPDLIRDALGGVREADLDVRPAADAWTIREIVHHLADAETMAASRLRRLLGEDRPAIARYDDEEFARRLHYDRPIGTSLELLAASRRSGAELLDRIDEAEWSREGTHDAYGSYSIEYLVERAAAHCPMHADQIRRARAGKP